MFWLSSEGSKTLSAGRVACQMGTESSQLYFFWVLKRICPGTNHCNITEKFQKLMDSSWELSSLGSDKLTVSLLVPTMCILPVLWLSYPNSGVCTGTHVVNTSLFIVNTCALFHPGWVSPGAVKEAGSSLWILFFFFLIFYRNRLTVSTQNSL